MALRVKNPITAGQRFQTVDTFDDITKHEPEKSLLRVIKKKGGRDATGRVSMRNRGGGNRKFYRLIDFKRDKDNVKATVVGIEYDPNRNARIALVQYTDSERRYVLSPLGLKVGDMIISGDEVDITVGNAMPLKNMPIGTVVHNVELNRGGGGVFARSAGSFAQLVAKEKRHAILRLPSGEQRMVNTECRATVGQVGNLDASNISLGKAGRSRHLGIKPHVRGLAMNPCDHPHGGGEGRSGIGRKRPVSPTGVPALGFKTRKKRKISDRFILIRRK